MTRAPGTSSPRTLLAVLAHPDDESLGLGGTIARYAAEGAEVVLVTATLGQRGRYRGIRPGEPGHPGAEALAEIRETELRAAAETLGVREVVLLGYMDGELDRVDPRELVRRVAGVIRRVRPQVIVTFSPDGGYGHPDHIAVSQLALSAAVAAADSAHAGGENEDRPHAVAKLYYMAWPEAKMAAYEAAFRHITVTVDGVERSARGWPEWNVTTVIDTREHWPTVWRAVRCHESQIAQYEKLKDLPPEHHEALWGSQHFYRAASSVNGGRTREADLFEGLPPGTF